MNKDNLVVGYSNFDNKSEVNPSLIAISQRLRKSDIELITCEAGDWEVLLVDGVIFSEGHSIPNHEWIRLIGVLNNEVETKEISDDDMEAGIY